MNAIWSGSEPDWLPWAMRILAGVTVIFLTALCASLLARRASAAARHRVWSLAALASLCLPVLIAFAPQYRLGWLHVPPPSAVSPQSIEYTTAVEPTGVAIVEHAVRAAPAAPIVNHVAPTLAASKEPENQRAQEVSTPEATPENWRAWAQMVWATGSALLSARLIAGAWLAPRSVRNSRTPNNSAAEQLLRDLATQFRVRRLPALLENGETDSPLCFGVWTSTIVLPADWPTWSLHELRAALAHELAHAQRRDVAWQWLACWACTAYWFHPLAWWGAWRMRVEREVACDDCVLNAGERPTEYARLLLSLGSAVRAKSDRAPLSAVAMAGRSQLESRIREVLRTARCRAAVSRATQRKLALSVATLLVALAVLQPFGVAQSEATKESIQEEDKEPVENVASDAIPEDARRVAVTVLNEAGDRIAGAEVTLHVWPAALVATTNDEGVANFDVVDRKTTLEAHAAAAVDSRNGTRGYAMLPTALAADAFDAGKSLPIEVTLRAPRSVRFEVRDGAGKPVADAAAVVVCTYDKFGESRTDAEGKVEVFVPSEAPLMYAVAFKQGVGLDYFMYRRASEPKSDPYRLEPDHSQPIAFTLNGLQHIDVKVVDHQDRPVEGADVNPWYFERPNKGGMLNSGLKEFNTKSNAEGHATIDMIPSDNTGKVPVWVQLDGFAAETRYSYDPQAPAPIDVKLLPLVPIAGRVLHADGSPAANIDVMIVGDGYSLDSFRETARTATDGTFAMSVTPNYYYAFCASDAKWASPIVSKVILDTAPAEPIELRLQPAVHVRGRLTIGGDKPFAGRYISLYQRVADYYALPEEDRLPNPKNDNKGIGPLIVRGGMTDDDGRFDFIAGPGAAYIIGPNSLKPPKFTVADQDIELTLNADAPDAVPITGRVVDAEAPDEGIAGAVIRAYSSRVSRVLNFDATTDADGNFAAERGVAEMYARAVSADGQRMGIVKIGRDDAQTTISIGPTAIGHARLVHAKSGKPLAKSDIRYGYEIHFDDGTTTTVFGGETTTDADGSFIIKDLVPGWVYNMSLITAKDADGHPRSWRPFGTTKAERGGEYEAGVYYLEPPEIAPLRDKKGRPATSAIKKIADRIAATAPGWRVQEVDEKPRELVEGYQGYRINLRRTWREYTGVPQQRVEVASAGPDKEHDEDWEFMLVPTEPTKAPASLKSSIPWQPSNSPQFTRDICLGEADGYIWFTRGTIPLQHSVRTLLQLQGGDDPIQIAADGLLVEDTGTNTANSSISILAYYSDRAVPYVEATIQEALRTKRDPWRAVMGLSKIQTAAATDALLRLYNSPDEPLRRPAAYALIHKPYRHAAKTAYLKMLEEHTSLESVAEACAEFGWKEAIPRLQDIIDHPKNLSEVQYAFYAVRRLEDRPIARELLDAEQKLRQGTRVEESQALRQRDAARRTLIDSVDTVPANLAALSLAIYTTKGDASEVRRTGLEILKLRPRDETLAFLRSLAERIDPSEREAVDKIALDVAK